MFLNRLRRKLKLALRNAIMSTGVELYRHTADRRMLEKIILPYFAESHGYERILFIGCDWYTRGYRRYFPEREYWTLDCDPAKQRFGSQRHIVDSMANLANHFPEGQLDLIVCNGVFGYGLNERADVEQAAVRNRHMYAFYIKYFLGCSYLAPLMMPG